MATSNDQPTSSHGWEESLEDLDRRRSAARAMGGPERLERHHAAGKLDARARVCELLDPGTFREIGTLVGGDVPADGFVAGTGTIDARPVMVGAEDFTTLAGTIAGGSNAKRYRIAELAVQERVPLIMMLEGAGFRPTDAGHGRSPTDLVMQAQCSGKVPVITAVMGASAGHGALVAPMSDFTIMTQQASIFTAGPPVVLEATGEQIDKLDLGGPSVAIPSGLIHALANDDFDVLDIIAQYLAYFPSSAWSYPPDSDTGDTEERELPELLQIIPRDNRSAYDMKRAIEAVFDGQSWMEVQAGFGDSLICALAHLGGHPVAVVANQPLILAGALDSDAADKAAHFISVADAFHLPIVFLSDNPGMLPGSRSEREGILRSGARMYAAQTLADTIKLHVTFRKAYGFGSMVMAMGAFEGQTASFAFPGATLGAMSAAASGRAMGAEVEQATALRQAELEASYASASRLGFDELIDPRETRNALLGALDLALARRQAPTQPLRRTAITP
ncbi:MAG: carboxyl transferase domain-containing protein [Acidimicrobiales bacterium]|nr:carboxyl transferase domain-containing protein [Acidimicrobiales bacterium]